MTEFYPADTSPERGPHCDVDGCLLSPEHIGDHNSHANWNAHVRTGLSGSGTLEIDFRSWHDSRAIRIHSRNEGIELITFLTGVIDRTFPDVISGALPCT